MDNKYIIDELVYVFNEKIGGVTLGAVSLIRKIKDKLAYDVDYIHYDGGSIYLEEDIKPYKIEGEANGK